MRNASSLKLLAVLFMAQLLVACGGGSETGSGTSNASTPPATAIAPSIGTQPADQTVSVGQTASFSVAASGSDPLSYQWTRDGAAISGATAAMYTSGPATTGDNGATFAVTVTNAVGSMTSNAATLTVTATPTAVAPAISSQPANTSVMVGQTASFTVVASGTAPLSYQWKRGGSAIAGATGSSYTTPATSASDNGATFTVTVTNATGSATSDAATLTVTTAAVAPTISKQPANATVTAGQTATFTVTAGGTAPLSYQWKRGANVIAGATSASYTTPATSASDSGATFTVTVKNATGSATSNAATLTVTTAAVAPTISKQPVNATVTAGQTATFNVTASGNAPLSYQWKRGANAIAGATSASYTTPATSASDNGATFTVTVSNATGSATSNAATLTVTAAAVAPTISQQPANATVTAGQTATFTVTASGTAALSYQWKRGGSAIAGATSSSYTTPATSTADNGATFSVTVTNSAGSITSGNAVLTVNPVSTGGTAPFGHVVIVVEENEDAADIVGNTAAMPYLNSLITKYGLASQYYANTHPSIGNYMMLVTGQVLTNNDDETPASFPVSVDNVVRQLVANGKTWKAYSEDLPSVGYTGGDAGNFAVRHAPLGYLTDVQNSSTQKNNLVPFSKFALDMAAGQLPNYSFVTPNLCDDGHDCGVDVADGWLVTNIEPLLTSTPFKDDGLLIIVFDESSGDNTHGGGLIAAVVISPAFSKPGYRSTTLYQHQSTLRLMLEGLGVKSLPGAAATAPAMWEFFTFPPPP